MNSPRHGRACPGHPRLASIAHEGRLAILHDQSARWRTLRRRHQQSAEPRIPASRSLVYYEYFDDIRDAIQREKTIKHWPRAWKVRLIHSMNPDWDDLYDTLI